MRGSIVRNLAQPAAGAKPRTPLRTLREMAAHIGVDYLSLKAILISDLDAPRRQFELGVHSRGQDSAYYDPVQFMKWWRTRQSK